MVAMKSKEQEDEVPTDRVPHLPWMRHPVDIDSFSGYPVTTLPRLDPRYHHYSLGSCFLALLEQRFTASVLI
jgi:hypothetical protein